MDRAKLAAEEYCREMPPPARELAAPILAKIIRKHFPSDDGELAKAAQEARDFLDYHRRSGQKCIACGLTNGHFTDCRLRAVWGRLRAELSKNRGA